MNTKLTLTLEQKVVENAKIYAKKRKRSLSSIFENYLKSLIDAQPENHDISTTVRSMKGAFKEPKNFDYRKELTAALSEKHL